MKKNQFIKLLGIAVPVLIAAFSEYSDIMEQRNQEKQLDDMEERIALLEQKDSE